MDESKGQAGGVLTPVAILRDLYTAFLHLNGDTFPTPYAMGWAEMTAAHEFLSNFVVTRPTPAAAADYEAHQANGLAWAVSCWQAEVSQRPLVNVHRRTLDDTWRQVIRYFGGDPVKLLGPDHDTLHMQAQEDRAWKP